MTQFVKLNQNENKSDNKTSLATTFGRRPIF